MHKQKLLRVQNRALVLNSIRQHGSISRVDVSRHTGLSVGAVTALTRELVDSGLIYEKQEGDSRGGRPPILLALQPEGAYVVGAKLTEDHITFALTNLDADVIGRLTLENPGIEPEAVAQRVADGIHRLVAESRIQRSRLLGVGIGMAGIVDAETGVCHTSPILGWSNVPFADMVEQRTILPVYLDNDVNTLTLVEKLYGAGVGSNHFLTITVGRGIGLGIVVNGQLYRGMGGAGEFGHTVIDPHGYTCDCGKRGCLETFVGDPWLLRRAAEHDRHFNTIDELFHAAQSGDSVVLDLVRQAGATLGYGIAMLVNVLNPQLLIFSGEGMRYGDLLLEPMRQGLYANAMSTLSAGLKMHVEPLGDDAWARGAASLVLQELFRTSARELDTVGV
ncbi:MAG: ROK family transcriptional regulator [Chloroflexi bacterium]|nr:ROK family transcriptional regulator [Chloroflexota bacterium]MCC6895279.1 ROK family transcriptional regulator [Anaerolineae bacterium]